MPEIVPLLTHICPLVVLAQGVPSLKWKLFRLKLLQAGAEPVTSNLSLSKVPLPASAVVPKPETTSWPGVLLLKVIVKALLSVPA